MVVDDHNPFADLDGVDTAAEEDSVNAKVDSILAICRELIFLEEEEKSLLVETMPKTLEACKESKILTHCDLIFHLLGCFPRLLIHRFYTCKKGEIENGT